MDKRHEIPRRHETTDRMPPANESFRAHQPAIVETDLRLIEKLQLVPVDGPPKLGFERQPRFDLIPYRAFKENAAAAARRLGPVKREVGIAKKFVRRRAMVRINSDTDAGVDAKLAFADRERDFTERNRRLFRQFFRPLHRIGTADDDGELVTAQPGNQTGAVDQGG